MKASPGHPRVPGFLSSLFLHSFRVESRVYCLFLLLLAFLSLSFSLSLFLGELAMSRLAALLSLFLSFPLSSFLLVSTWQWRPSEAFRPLSLTKRDSSHYAAAVGSNERYSLDLCDCEAAVGPPGGLSCSKEGFFVADFERQGQWVAGGGTVPLSRAICCRPCLPRELADALSEESATRTSGVARHLASKRRVGDDAVAQMVSSIVKVSARALPPGLVTALASGSRPVSVVSLGCHGSTDALPLRCEATADSFVVRHMSLLWGLKGMMCRM